MDIDATEGPLDKNGSLRMICRNRLIAVANHIVRGGQIMNVSLVVSEEYIIKLGSMFEYLMCLGRSLHTILLL